jgi:hypothetical protein
MNYFQTKYFRNILLFSNTNCSWRIEAPTVDEKIIINVEDFKAAGTTVDYLNVYDSCKTEFIKK